MCNFPQRLKEIFFGQQRNVQKEQGTRTQKYMCKDIFCIIFLQLGNTGRDGNGHQKGSGYGHHGTVNSQTTNV